MPVRYVFKGVTASKNQIDSDGGRLPSINCGSLSPSCTLPQTCAYTYMNKHMYITQRHTRRKEKYTDRQTERHTRTLATWNLHISSCHVDCSAVCCHGTLFLHVVLKHCLAAYSSNLQGLSSRFLEHRDVAMKFIILYLSENSSFFLHFSKDCLLAPAKSCQDSTVFTSL